MEIVVFGASRGVGLMVVEQASTRPHPTKCSQPSQSVKMVPTTRLPAVRCKCGFGYYVSPKNDGRSVVFGGGRAAVGVI